MARKDSTRDFWQQHYQTFKTAETTQREYCRQNNIGYWSFNKWKRRLDQENTSTSLQQLPVKYAPMKPENLELILHDGLKISIPENFSEDTLKKIISALRGEL
jgi:hypothetical protein